MASATGDDPGDQDLRVALETIERMILAHACAGVDVSFLEYVAGLSTVIEAASNAF